MEVELKYEKSLDHFFTPKILTDIKIENIFLECCNIDKVCKVSDWLNTTEKKSNRNYGQSSYQNYYMQSDEDDDNYINNYRGLRTNNQNRNKIKLNFQKYRQNRDVRRASYNNRYQSKNKKGNTNQNRGRYDRQNSNYWFRKASVMVRDTWKLMEDIDFPQLSKLKLPYLPTVKDVYTAGAIQSYDKSYDYIKPGNSIKLKSSTHVFHKVPTCDDPIIRANVDKAKVFASDTLISTLMSCTRSVASWDIVVHRVSNYLFFDKRAESDIEMLTVNETCNDVKFDHYINSPTALSLEATLVNQNYSQQCLLGMKTIKKMKNKNPFFDNDTELSAPSVAYKYRVFDLGDGVEVLVRCEFDAYSQNDKIGGINIKSLLEYGTKSSMCNWREDFDTLSGSILATEIKNNSNKFAKWTACAIMAGENLMKIGLISRDHYLNNKNHSIIGSISVASSDLAVQIGLNMHHAWGIIFALTKKLLTYPEGKYVIFKDPLKQALRVYSVPDSNLNSDEGSIDDIDDDQLIRDNQNFDFELDDI